MKTITDFNVSIEICNITKFEDPVVFEKAQIAIASAFEIQSAQDTYDDNYNYVVSIDKENDEIVSGYRYVICKDARCENGFTLNTFKYYQFSDEFSTNYADFTLELGRSFVNPTAKRRIWGLFSIWECGLGPLINYQREHNGIQYILGQVSLKESIYDIESIKAILKMFWINFGTNEFLFPRGPAFSQSKLENYEDLNFTKDYKQNKKTLIDFLRKKNQPRPTLFLSYADLVEGTKEGLRCFLPIYNPLLKCFEMGFLLRISEISPENQEKYLSSSYDSKAFE